MILEEQNRKEMYDLAEAVLAASPDERATESYVAKTRRLAELAYAFAACGKQGGKVVLTMTCIKCNQTFTSDQTHTCGG